jgi:hypothetical protein
LAIVLSAPLRYTDSDYTYGILKLFLLFPVIDIIERKYNTTLLSQVEFEETKGVIRIVYRRRTEKTVKSHE